MSKEEERQFHRRTASRCFNLAWELLEKSDRSPQDTQKMLSLVHTSRFHWSLVGSPENFAISDWQISRVYAAIREPTLALLYARSALETCQKHGLTALLPSVYEVMARAYAVGGDTRYARTCVKKARELLASAELSDEDRRTYDQQIRETELMIARRDSRVRR